MRAILRAVGMAGFGPAEQESLILLRPWDSGGRLSKASIGRRGFCGYAMSHPLSLRVSGRLTNEQAALGCRPLTPFSLSCLLTLCSTRSFPRG
jgi:hypothetical protein